MKKIFALLPMVAAFALCGCGDNKKEEEQGEGENLPMTQEQAKAKVKELGETEGFEISFKYTSSGSESSEMTEATIGSKGGYYWVFAGENSKTMWQIENENVHIYSYDSESAKFSKVYTYTKEYLEENGLMTGYSFDIYSPFIYMGNMYDGFGGYHKVKDTTFVGRSATEYQLKESNGVAYVQAKVIIDKETGITLYWGVSGADIQGQSGSASYEVTSFKTGDQVSVPAIKTEA